MTLKFDLILAQLVESTYYSSDEASGLHTISCNSLLSFYPRHRFGNPDTVVAQRTTLNPYCHLLHRQF